MKLGRVVSRSRTARMRNLPRGDKNMNRLLGAVAVAALWCCESSGAGRAAQVPGANEILGEWELTVLTFGEQNAWRMVLNGSGDRITGRAGLMSVEGSFRGNSVEFQLRLPNGKPFGNFIGQLQGSKMAGEGKVADGPATWSARRPQARPPGAPRVHDFQAQNYYRVFSYSIPPALRIFPGDTVRTKTIDALGLDENLVRRGNEGNPMTGPFFVEGALAGDTLVIHFNRIRPNRNSARSGHKIYPVVVSSDYFSHIKPVDDYDSRWDLDTEHQVARLLHPLPVLKDLTVPLQPMLGCVGVAPWGQQSWAAHHLGDFGGNLDYNQIQEGATLYLPVFHPGALLFMGDGHAAEGDGELAALETSLDVEFTVDVLRDKSIEFPRAENEEYRMALGIGGSITDATQLATTNLMKWLEDDYHLNAAELAIVLGTGMRYDIAEIVDPEMQVVAKISKRVLAQLHAGESNKPQ